MNGAFYNEIDPYCAQWLRNLIDAGHIAPGVVDERSIEDIAPNELREYTQVHCFAGIGVWSYALRLAGWPDDRPVWTGSCPCQPFSSAGKGHGFADERHLWPAWHHLIRECRPSVVFGEQVENAITHGWVDLVATDLESCGYAFGAIGVPAAAVSDHSRERVWFVADADLPIENQWAPSGEQSLCHQDARTSDRSNVRLIRCSDGLVRAAEPGAQPLAHGIAKRMDKLRAYGNAINAEVAAAVIGAYMQRGEAVMEQAA